MLRVRFKNFDAKASARQTVCPLPRYLRGVSGEFLVGFSEVIVLTKSFPITCYKSRMQPPFLPSFLLERAPRVSRKLRPRCMSKHASSSENLRRS
jgi:hypothetical protein